MTAQDPDLEPRWLLPLVLAAAVAGGLAADQIGPAGRINILAPPMLALIAWNLVVFAVVLVRSVRPNPPATSVSAPPRAAARIALALHLGAALFAATMLASLYARGLAFEYRAGWDSTFLGARQVHSALAVVLGPASAVSGITLPDVAALERLRFSQGPGENAARWIHLYAWTVLGLVVLPRLLLAARAAFAARRLRTPPASDAGRIGITALPYGYAGASQRREALRSELARLLGRPVDLHLLENLPLGGEDDLARVLPAIAGDEPFVLLFPMAATPERETHGALLRGVRAAWPRRRLIGCVDSSAFRARLDPGVMSDRLTQRGAAWEALFAQPGLGPVEFHVVDLAPDGG